MWSAHFWIPRHAARNLSDVNPNPQVLCPASLARGAELPPPSREFDVSVASNKRATLIHALFCRRKMFQLDGLHHHELLSSK
jgi:hypothetical protein